MFGGHTLEVSRQDEDRKLLVGLQLEPCLLMDTSETARLQYVTVRVKEQAFVLK